MKDCIYETESSIFGMITYFENECGNRSIEVEELHWLPKVVVTGPQISSIRKLIDIDAHEELEKVLVTLFLENNNVANPNNWYTIIERAYNYGFDGGKSSVQLHIKEGVKNIFDALNIRNIKL